MGLQDEAVNVERNCGARRCRFVSPRAESGQQGCAVEVDFLNGFEFR